VNDPTLPPSPAVRRPLTVDELQQIHAAITTADSTPTIIAAVLGAVFDALLADTGTRLADFGPERPLNPRDYSIPRTQWTAITTAAANHAGRWGSGATTAVELLNRLPDSYDDPDSPDPGWPQPDHRPTVMQLRLDRDATDVVAAAHLHLDALAGHYGPASARHLDALTSWTTALGTLLRLNLGSPVQVHRDGPLSLLVNAPSLTYTVLFHGQPRTCTMPDCGIRLPDQPDTTNIDPDRCQHRPSYPYDAPQPGTWTIHS
jgi:hypothetical protein